MAQFSLFLKILVRLTVTLIIVTLVGIKPTFSLDQTVCNEIAQQVESESGLPSNILRSIALVEAGRRVKDGSFKPWPWSLNHAGKSLFFDTKSDALLYLNRNISSKFKNIDVGCMQINVKWHEENFSSFAAMIDPETNIKYAASFLKNLKKTHGTWEDAIKHYHSATPKLNVKYFAKVETAWNDMEKSSPLQRNASLFIDEDKIYLDNRIGESATQKIDKKKNLDANRQEMLTSNEDEIMRKDNEIYFNASLIKNNRMFDKVELKRYIKYNSAYLGKNIDMILLFREEFSQN